MNDSHISRIMNSAYHNTAVVIKNMAISCKSLHRAGFVWSSRICDKFYWKAYIANGTNIKWEDFPRCLPCVRRIHRSPVDSPHKGQRLGALIFPLICAWTNGWASNRGAGDLRRHRARYNVTVMEMGKNPSISAPTSSVKFSLYQRHSAIDSTGLKLAQD